MTQSKADCILIAKGGDIMNNEELSKRFDKMLDNMGDKIKKRRLKKGWTCKELGEKAGLSESYIYQLEQADRKASLKTLYKICNAFNIQMSTFFRS